MSLTPEMREELRTLLSATRAALELERACGSAGVQILPRPVSHDRQDRIAPDPVNVPVPGPAPDLAAPFRSASAAAISPDSSQRVALPLEERLRKLEVLAQEAASCTACVLHEKRTKNVFARGSASSEIAFVGEGPGRDEDLQGLPFVGAAGQLLDRMITAMGYGRDEVYVCNVVKCRPPENRTPRPEEMLACSRYLVPQLDIVAPKLIVALGRCAAQALGVAEVTGPWRGRFGAWRGIPVMPTYHPAFLLRSPEFKRVVWEDLQQVMGRLGRSAKRAES